MRLDIKTEQASLQATHGLTMVLQETVNAEMNGSSVATLNDHGLPVSTPIEGSSQQQHTSTDAAAETRRKARGEQVKCAQIDCMKLASRKGAMHQMCIAHGGGRRCQYENCVRTCARTGTNPQFCLSHGGGKRCADVGCQRLAVSPTQFCKSHGGGKRCTSEGCTKPARWPKELCISHGGGPRCKRDGCEKLAKAKGGLCIAHSRTQHLDTPHNG